MTKERAGGTAINSADLPVIALTIPEHTTDEFGDQDLEVTDLDDSIEFPLIPWCDTSDDEFGSRWVDYSDRGPNDVVVSGPVIGGWGPGRWHKNRRVAYWRLVSKYGSDRVKPTKQSQGRWSFLIKGLKSV